MQLINYTVLILLACCSFFSIADTVKLKSGKRYFTEVIEALNFNRSDYRELYLNNRILFSKAGRIGDVHQSKLAYAKIAGTLCSDSELFSGDETTFEELFTQIFRRPPNEIEVKNQINDDEGNFHYMANCFYFLLHPDFITYK